uniref:hypothetical protein n=1 Tax=Burkholderia sp. M701 TaxID=326454 RepID=UPI00159EC27E|nr:hypothetical protein [Burkholderia sp. M701]
MKTVAQLRAAGFTVKPSASAIGGTDVESAEQFFFLNLRFLDGIAQAAEQLDRGRAERGSDGVFRIIVAGQYADDAEFPLLILKPLDAENLTNSALFHATALEDAEAARARAKSHEDQFNGLIRDLSN